MITPLSTKMGLILYIPMRLRQGALLSSMADHSDTASQHRTIEGGRRRHLAIAGCSRRIADAWQWPAKAYSLPTAILCCQFKIDVVADCLPRPEIDHLEGFGESKS